MALLEQSGPQTSGGRLRRAGSLFVSAVVHGSILAWVALGPLPHEDTRSLYEQSFQAHEKRIVWYNLRDKLPDVKPLDRHDDPRPPRIEVKAPQLMVSEGEKKGAQTIWLPEPHLEAPKELPSPNLLAFAPAARPVRKFTPPELKPRTVEAPKLPEPEIRSAAQLKPAPVEAAAAKPQPRAFAAPPTQAPQTAPVLPEAPQLASVPLTPAPVAATVGKPQPRAFTPPPSSTREPSSPSATRRCSQSCRRTAQPISANKPFR